MLDLSGLRVRKPSPFLSPKFPYQPQAGLKATYIYFDVSGDTWLRSRSMSIPSAFRVVGKNSHRIFTRILYGLKYVTVSSRLPTELNARHLAFICLCVVIVGVLPLYTLGDLAFVISLRSC